MTQRFWYHLVLCAALLTAVTVFIRLTGYAPVTDAITSPPDIPGGTVVVYLAALGFLYLYARLALRVAGSDRTTGLLSVYAVALFAPFVASITGSLARPLVLLLVTAAVVEIVDINVARANAVRSGLYMSAACILEPACAIPALALVPVAIAVARRRWTLSVRYALAVVVPWVLYHMARGFDGALGAAASARGAIEAWDVRTVASALASEASRIRATWEGDLYSAYTAFGLAGLLAGTVRRFGPSRRGVFAVAWLLAVVTFSAATLGEGFAELFRPLAYALLVLLAGAGLAALAAMNPLHAGRRRMIPVGVFFLLPQVVVWVKLLR
jgi:hypothetical protein